jgi:hypothetical protein
MAIIAPFTYNGTTHPAAYIKVMRVEEGLRYIFLAIWPSKEARDAHERPFGFRPNDLVRGMHCVKLKDAPELWARHMSEANQKREGYSLRVCAYDLLHEHPLGVNAVDVL